MVTRKQASAFAQMFTDHANANRAILRIPECYPTHPQAEVLVFDRIPPDYIAEVHFDSPTVLNQWRLGGRNYSRQFHVNKNYFSGRQDWNVWYELRNHAAMYYNNVDVIDIVADEIDPFADW